MEENFSVTEETAAEEKTTSWIEGFIDIFYQPSNIGQRPLKTHFGKIFSFGVLLFMIGAVFQAYISSANEGIRQETLRMRMQPLERMAEKQKITPEQLQKSKEDMIRSLEFSFPTALGFSAGIGALSILVGALIFWAVAFFVKKEPIEFTPVLAAVSYGTAITCVGYLVTGLMQFLGNSLRVAPNLGGLVSMDDSPYLFSFLSRVSVFMLWEYFAVGLAIASAIFLQRAKGYVIGTAAIIIVLISYGVFSYIPKLFIQ